MKLLLHSGPLKINTTTATFLVVLAGLGFGTIPFFTKSLADDGMPAYAIVFYRYVVTATVLFPILISAAKQKTAIAWGIAAGFAVGLGWIGYVNALEAAPVASVGVLYMTFPVFTLLVGWVWFGETPSIRAVIAAFAILFASALALEPSAVSSGHIPALIIALSAPMTFGFAINVLTRKLTEVPPLARIASLALGAVLGLLPLVALSDISAITPKSDFDGWLVVGSAAITFLIPQALYATFAPVIGAARTSMAGSVELPTNFVIGWLAFSQAIGPAHWLAGVVILGAIFMTPVHEPSEVSAEPTLAAES